MRRLHDVVFPRHITLRTSGGVHIAEIANGITFGASSEHLQETVGRLVGAGAKRIIIDLWNTRQIDACGMGTIISSYRRVAEQGGEIKLVVPGDEETHPARLFEPCGFVYDSVQAAIDSFREPR